MYPESCSTAFFWRSAYIMLVALTIKDLEDER